MTVASHATMPSRDASPHVGRLRGCGLVVTRCARLGECFRGDEQGASEPYIHSQSGQGSIAESGGECSQELLYRACRRVRRACRRILIRCLFPRSSLDRITCPSAWREVCRCGSLIWPSVQPTCIKSSTPGAARQSLRHFCQRLSAGCVEGVKIARPRA